MITACAEKYSCLSYDGSTCNKTINYDLFLQGDAIPKPPAIPELIARALAYIASNPPSKI